MRTTSKLPDGYKEIYKVDMQNDNKMMLLVNGIALLITVAMIIPAAISVPFSATFSFGTSPLMVALRLICLFAGIVAYMVLHELIHGIAMKICGTEKIKYGFTGAYAFAGSEDYYGKAGYIFIALSPVVIFTIVFAFLCHILPREWFWVAYAWQISNISGAAGDYFVTLRFIPMPRDILIKDVGVSMRVYSKVQSTERRMQS